MSSQPVSQYGPAINAEGREANWLLIDKRPLTAEIITYGPDIVAEIRRSTDVELKRISRRSTASPGLNKETQAFLDAATVVRALSRVAEERFEQGKLDEAAHTAINAIRWERFADGLYLSGGVSLPRTDPTRLWYLLVEIYTAMGEHELANKTVKKASAAIGEPRERPLPETPDPADPDKATAAAHELPQGLSWRLIARLTSICRRRSTLIAGVLILGLLIFVAFRAQVSAKSMIDSNSVGVDYLNIAFGRDPGNPPQDALLLAAEQFARLRAQLESWSWLITVSAALPPAHDQFVAMDRMADLGSRLVAAPLAGSSRQQLAERGSTASVCAAANRLMSFDGDLLGQLEKNRTQMLQSVSAVTTGACGGLE